MVYIHKMLIRHLFVFNILLVLLRKTFSINSIPSCFIAFLPFLISISLFLLSLFILALLFYCFPLLVVDLASSTEEVSEYIYQSIGDNSDSPFAGDQGIDPIPVEIDSIHPSPREDFSEIPVSDGDEQYSNEYQDSHSGSHPSFSGEKGQLPCIEDNDHWEDHNPEEILADKSNFPEPPVPAPTPTSSVITSKQGFFASLFTKASKVFHSLISNPTPDDDFKESMAKYQNSVARYNRAIYNRAVREAYHTPICSRINEHYRRKISFDEFVKFHIKPPADHWSWTTKSPADSALAIRKLLSLAFSKNSSTRKP